MRILGARRLSHGTDASTSIERQGEAIERYADAGGHTLVDLTEDVDVSGAVSPFDRPDLRPWLTDPAKLAQWDAIAVTKLDRLSRSLIHLLQFVTWLTANNKVLISTSENIDLSTPMGKVFVQLLGIFAEFERTRMSERRADAAIKIRSNGHYGGGQGIPDGYRAVKIGSHYELELDPMPAAVITELALTIVNGSSIRAACKTANANGYRTVKGKLWDASSVCSMLRNQSLRGYVMHDGQPVRGDDGMPITRDAVIGDDLWTMLQARLDVISRKDSGVRYDAAMLLRVLYWGNEPLYMHRRPGRGDRYRTGPKVEKSASFMAETVEVLIHAAFMIQLGDTPMFRYEITPAEDHTRELQQVETAIAEIEDQVIAGLPAASATRMLAKLETKRETLAAMPSRPEQRTRVETGQTFGDVWNTLNGEAKHRIMVDNRVRAEIFRGQVDTPADGWDYEVYEPKSKYTIRVNFGTLLDRAA